MTKTKTVKIIKYTKNNHQLVVNKALEVLQKGGVFVFPTETCYGIGADATNKKAIEKLYSYKTRREGKPLSIAVSGMEMAKEYVEMNEIAENLYKNYLPGPITVVSKGLGNVVNGVESEYGTLGIRIPDYKLVLDIVVAFGKPFTATSANISYKKKPYSIEALLRDTPEKSQKLIDLIIDAGELSHNETSTVVDTTLNNLNIMRDGQISLEKEIKKRKSVLEVRTDRVEDTIAFGGMNMLKYIDESNDKPLVFFLNGEMGSGKTHFSKGLAQKLGIKNIIKSPTFTILNEYKYKLGKKTGKFVHIDTWRLDGVRDLETIGFDDYLVPGNIIVVEWADKFFDDLKGKIEMKGGKIINIKLDYIDEDTRELRTYD